MDNLTMEIFKNLGYTDNEIKRIENAGGASIWSEEQYKNDIDYIIELTGLDADFLEELYNEKGNSGNGSRWELYNNTWYFILYSL